MPHLVILYTGQLEAESDMTALCRAMADTMLAQRDDEGQAVFPSGGVRVFAYPAPHHAVADGRRDYAFVYLNLRMAAGRSAGVQQRTGEALLACARLHFEPLLAQRHLGLTLQIDEGAQVYDGRLGNIHALFGQP
jgi:5-carboxymethyl-2-hydroxymuconate isomerase